MQNDWRSSKSDTAIAGSAASRLASVFSDVLRVPTNGIHPDLGPLQVPRWDSVGHVALILAIEEEFAIHFDVDDIMEFTSFGSILKVIERVMALSPGETSGAERVA